MLSLKVFFTYQDKYNVSYQFVEIGLVEEPIYLLFGNSATEIDKQEHDKFYNLMCRLNHKLRYHDFSKCTYYASEYARETNKKLLSIEFISEKVTHPLLDKSLFEV